MVLSPSAKLNLLGYPYVLPNFDGTAAPSTDSAVVTFKHVVVFLEDTIICALEPAKRDGLRTASSLSAFQNEFTKYLVVLGHPSATVAGANICSGVKFVINHATQLHFNDGAESFNSLSAKVMATSAWDTFSEMCAANDGKDVLDGVNTLLAHLGYPPVSSAVHGLTTLLLMVKALQRRDPSKPAMVSNPEQLLQTTMRMPYSVGKPKVDLVLRALHLLYTAELRVLQDTLNEAVAEMQMYTSDPRTDTSQACVGS